MLKTGQCVTCGSPTPPDHPAGLPCARCRAGAVAPTDTPTEPATPGGRLPAPPEPQDLARHFPQLDIEGMVGQGGMGTVYRARQTKLDRPVALKILSREIAQFPSFAERFEREARALARVSHPNIVAIHDFGEAGGFYYLLMELVEGTSLRSMLRAGRLEPQQALSIVAQICDALQFAHDEGVVHRDIKPENILVDRRGRVKVADYGLAKIVQAQPTGYTLTIPGQVMGTPAYMAPEQIETPTNVDHRADIFSLGVVLYEMLTGELPLGRFPAPSEKTGIDSRLDEVVLRALEKERELRYQRASEVKDAVTSVAASLVRVDAAGDSAPAPAGTALPARAAPGAPAVGAGGASAGRAPHVISFRTVEVRRSKAVTRAAWFSFAMAALYPTGMFLDLPAATGLELHGLPGLLGEILSLLVRVASFGMAVWHLLAGAGVLQLRARSRRQLIGLSILGVLFVPIGTLLSAVILHALLRQEVKRLFELGAGPATLSEEEAKEVEAAMGKKAAAS